MELFVGRLDRRRSLVGCHQEGSAQDWWREVGHAWANHLPGSPTLFIRRSSFHVFLVPPDGPFPPWELTIRHVPHVNFTWFASSRWIPGVADPGAVIDCAFPAMWDELRALGFLVLGPLLSCASDSGVQVILYFFYSNNVYGILVVSLLG